MNKLLTTVLILLLVQPAVADVTGRARVIDGDTVQVNDTKIRLKGVDAAEMNTPRGRSAKQAMQAIVGASPLTCKLTGEKTYKREVGYCFTAAGIDISRAIIEQGFALSCPRYDTRYVQYETNEAIQAQPRAKYCGSVPAPTFTQAPVPAPRSSAADLSASTVAANFNSNTYTKDA